MSVASLLLALPLWAIEPPPAPPADDSTDDDEIIIDGDEDEPADPDPAVAEPASAEPKPAPAPEKKPAAVKPAPSSEALARETTIGIGDDEPKDRSGRTGSPQNFALEVKLGPYLPDIDRAYSGPGLGPYAAIFGETDSTGAAVDQPNAVVMPVLGFDWQFFYLGGPLGIGAQMGFFRDKADALITVPTDESNVRSDADETVFGVVPMALLLSYRFELLADRFRVPLVPYAKGGLAYAFFWNTTGSGNLSRNSRSDVARGGVPGWQVNLGGMLRLDFIEPGTAKKLDRLTGINHTYLFGEYQISRIDNFGQGQVLNLGAATWFAGLAIEF
ncbi:MAG: MXAN_2562 family outer membrane beta-barrel protein [Myxococcota bacterium]